MELSCVGVSGGLVKLPGTMVDMCLIGGDRWLLDQEDVKVLGLVVINKRFHLWS
jgi:hypothetical protein